MGLEQLGVFSQPSQARGFLRWQGQGPWVRSQLPRRPLRSTGKMPPVFIFHLRLQEVGVDLAGWGQVTGDLRAKETYLRRPPSLLPPGPSC